MNTLDRFWRKVQILESGCWKWTGALSEKGYGWFGYRHNQCLPGPAHKFSYMEFIGPVPKGRVLDHLCDNKWCVNPCHVTPSTSRANTLRADTPAGRNHRKRYCKYGHAFSPQNTMMVHNKNWKNHPSRRCKVCAANTQRGQRAKKKAGILS